MVKVFKIIFFKMIFVLIFKMLVEKNKTLFSKKMFVFKTLKPIRIFFILAHK